MIIISCIDNVALCTLVYNQRYFLGGELANFTFKLRL